MPFKKIFRNVTRRLVIKLGVLLHEVNDNIADATLPKFGNRPKNLRIDLPRRIANPERMFFGNDIRLGPGSLLVAIVRYPPKMMQHPNKKHIIQRFNPKITIGNRVTATGDLQIFTSQEVTIEDDVMFASNIHINDGMHGNGHANEAYKFQKIAKIAPILIKRGSWIGQNVLILPGVTIGEFSIIGANSIVTRSIPARCIAIGSPAKVIRKWDETTQQWISVDQAEALM